MQRSAYINADCVFILTQEESSPKLHLPCHLVSNCAQKHVSRTEYKWEGISDIVQM